MRIAHPNIYGFFRHSADDGAIEASQFVTTNATAFGEILGFKQDQIHVSWNEFEPPIEDEYFLVGTAQSPLCLDLEGLDNKNIALAIAFNSVQISENVEKCTELSDGLLTLWIPIIQAMRLFANINESRLEKDLIPIQALLDFGFETSFEYLLERYANENWGANEMKRYADIVFMAGYFQSCIRFMNRHQHPINFLRMAHSIYHTIRANVSNLTRFPLDLAA